MRLRPWLPRLALAALACAAPPGIARAEDADDGPMTGSILRLFSDSDHVTVRSWMGNGVVPLARAGALTLHVNHEQVRIPAIHAPAGSAEAVDAITTASRPIAGNAFEDFVKVRNEVQGELASGPAELDYYVSHESDYLAQQVGGSVHRDFMNRQLDLSMGTSYGWDDIEPLADDDTRTGAARKTTLHWNAVATQVLTPSTLLRVGLELNVVDGLQHNPYRNVYAGGGPVPERHPDHRERRDLFLRVNQYLENRSSVKLSYRLYDDDWGVRSHEVGTRLSQYVTRGLSARWEYRWYTQSSADFYRDEYASADGIGGYRTGDYRLGELSSHLFGVQIALDLATFDLPQPVLGRMSLWLDVDRYFNSNNYSANIVESGLDYRF